MRTYVYDMFHHYIQNHNLDIGAILLTTYPSLK